MKFSNLLILCRGTKLSSYRRKINKIYGIGSKIIPYENFKCDRGLNGSYFNQTVNYSPANWEDMIIKMYNDFKEINYLSWKDY